MHIRPLHFALAMASLAAAAPAAQAGSVDIKIQTKDVGVMSFKIDPSSRDNARIQALDSSRKPDPNAKYGPGEPCDLDSTGIKSFQINGYNAYFDLYLMVSSKSGISGNIRLTKDTGRSLKVAFSNWTGAKTTFDSTGGVIKIIAESAR